jgi:mono/diheme cytochrome c family protein
VAGTRGLERCRGRPLQLLTTLESASGQAAAAQLEAPAAAGCGLILEVGEYCMMIFMGLGLLLGGLALSIWAGRRGWRLQSRFLKWSATLVTAVGSAACAAASVFVVNGLVKLHGREAPVPEIKVAGTREQIQRGYAIARSNCSDCHTKSAPLTGGLEIAEHFPLPMGSFISANLTPAGALSRWSDGQIFRAVRNSLDAQGHWLTIMSFTDASRLSDADIQAVIAYLRSVPAGGQPTPSPPDRLNLLGLILLGSGLLPTGKPVFEGVITAPPAAVSAAYGKYLVSYQDCSECHGRDLTGGVAGQMAPVGPDLNLVKAWKREEFIAALRTGTDPGGHVIGTQMPWRGAGRMSDDELSAVYEYLTHLGGPE